MPTPTNPKDKRYSVSLAFGEWDLIVCAMARVANYCDPASDLFKGRSSHEIAAQFTRNNCNRIIAKIRAEIPEIAK